jgi:hypothetical protein
MQRTLTYVVIMVILLLVYGCSRSNNFMVYKDATSFYITSDTPELKRILCDSDDMDRIAKDSGLPNSLQKELKDGICTSDKEKKRLVATLNEMTKDQLAALKDAFRKNGYEINKVSDICGGG